ncbi:MAG: carbohydrate-binding domain-containing protein [Prevotella sp.]|nr:carbohydrate-binding domain-containing protein [Prevotella sp.]
MKKVGMMIIALLLTIVAGAQTLNVQVGDVTYQFPAAQTGDMTYSNGTTLTIMGKEFAISDITGMVVDKSEVTDNQVTVSYNGTSAKVTVAGNVAQYLTPVVSGAHVSIAQSDDLAEEVTYTLSGESTDGEFYMSGSYKATIELNGLTLTNTTPVKSGAAVHIQNGKRIKVKVCTGTVNTLTDAVGGSQKGCLYVKGHAEFAQKGTLNIIGNVKHGIKTGEYMTLKNATINITKAAGDGINCAQFFQMTSGKIAISGVSDDGIQCDIEDSTVGSTGETTDHEDEDTGNIYLEGGDITASVTADAAKAIKAEGDIRATGTNVTATTSGGGVWDADKVKTKSSSCMSADGNMLISGGTLTLTSTGAGGKGINVDGNFTATGGNVTINTSGNAVVASSTGTLSVVTSSQQLDNYDSDYKSSPKGIKVDGAIVISDNAVISVTTTGAGGEGIESKTSIDITGGQTTVNASDDGINASKNTSTGGSGDLTISGGYVFSKSSGNDGIDANGNCYIKGGLVYAIGTTAPEKSIDANTEEGKKLYITGGTIIAVGDLENGASINGGTCKSASSWTANTWHALYNGGTLVAAFKTPASSGNSGGGPGGWPGGGGPGGGPGGGSQKLIVYTSSTPTVKSGITVIDGTEYFGGMANIGGTVSGGSDVSLSNYSSGGGWW